MILGAGYRDQWSKYASKFYSDANQPADVLCEFNDSLFQHIHSSLLLSLQERLSPVEREGLQHRRDELLAWLSQMDAGTACYGFSWTHEGLIDLWFDTWNVSLWFLISTTFLSFINTVSSRYIEKNSRVGGLLGKSSYKIST